MGNGIRYYDLLPVVNKRIIDNSLGDGFWSDYRHSGSRPSVSNGFVTDGLPVTRPELWIAASRRSMSALAIVRFELIASKFGVLPGFFEPLKVWSLIDAFWAMAVLRYPYCALQTPP